ncbi:MAG TPA: sensor domain-containing diguanylate cyclase [Xanthobacteraceae bacterium]|nr:sensor domain-containing diguanylate cyclase [Xanthobacteraceae bacterium]
MAQSKRNPRPSPIHDEDKPVSIPMLSPERIASVLFASGEAAYSWDCKSDAVAWSANAPTVLNVVSIEEISSGSAYAQLISPDSTQTRHDAVFSDQRKDPGIGVPYEIRYALKQRAPGQVCWIEDSGRWFAGADGKPARADGIVRNVTERYRREQELARLSQSDPLTGGLNRTVLTQAIADEFENATKFKTSFGFVVAAIDGLAECNQTYGYGVGDQVIAAIAERLRTHKRGKDLIGRFSDNKFGIVLHECSLEDLFVAGNRFVNAVREVPFDTSAGALSFTVTAGGVVAPRYARNAGEVIAYANIALEQAKAAGKGNFIDYQPPRAAMPAAATKASKKKAG